MDNISMILFAILLVLQIVLFIRISLDKRHSTRRYGAILNYIDQADEGVRAANDEQLEEFRELLAQKIKGNEEFAHALFDSLLEKNRAEFKIQHEVIQELEKKVIDKVNTLAVDYEEAQQAANKVNEFATGLASIFDYDPLAAIKKGRQKEAS